MKKKNKVNFLFFLSKLANNHTSHDLVNTSNFVFIFELRIYDSFVAMLLFYVVKGILV